MLEIVIIVALVVLMSRIASMEDRSPVLWGVITLVACIASIAIPLPFLRVLIAGVAVFIGMIVHKIITKS